MQISSKILVLLVFIFSTFNIFSASRDPVKSKNGMVVSASEIASKVGIEILKNGGNAIDAAVAVGFALAVVHPPAGNVGGGGFMVIHLNDGFNTTIDFRETAPSMAHKDMYLDNNGEVRDSTSSTGWTSSGVPGSVEGYLYALEKYGTMELSQVMKPAIEFASNGFVIGLKLAETINNRNEIFNKHKSSKELFTVKGDTLPEDHLLIQKDLANTLKLIRDEGRDGFYKGETAELIVEQSSRNGGIISLEDLANYSVVERESIKGKYKGFDIITMGPPSAGGINLIQILKILERFTITPDMWGSSKYIHLLTEIFKFVFADRAYHFGDSEYYSVPQDWLLSDEYTERIYSKINNTAIPSSEINHSIPQKIESRETTHFSVIDKDGNAVGTTITLNSSFGNRIIVDGAGFFMNNEMDDFSIKPGSPNLYGLVGSEANSIEGGKRMLSSMTPTILLEDGKPFMILGARGGSMIMTSVLQVVVNVIDFKMNIREAIDAPRIHHQWLPDELVHEKYGMTTDVKNNLIQRGHEFGEEDSIARVQGILIDNLNGIIWGASDSRSFGKAVGY
ncbi:gamma-glutamyltransferase [Bacteroidota bacterium]